MAVSSSRSEEAVTAAGPVPPSTAAILRACSWLEEEEDGLARVRNVSSSHNVHWAIRNDGAQAIVKSLAEAGRRGIAQELFVYRMAAWVPGLDRVLPQVLHIDESVPVLVLEALPREQNFPSQCDPLFYRKIGEALATIHRATLGIAMLPSLAAGVLDVADRPDGTGADRPQQTRALMHQIAGDPILAGALRQALADYRGRCLIHGDLRPGHWIEMPDGSLRLIDWEMGGGGDPALDLASAMVEPCFELLRSGIYDGDWIEAARPLLRALVEGYGGKGVLDLADQSLRDHSVRLAAARLLHVACEWADTGELGPAVEGAFRQARALLENRSEFAEILVP